ncbi:hypothetical protein R9O40_00090, partial [Escherichia coli]
MTVQTSKNPQVDIAEDNAFFPSEYSLSQYTSPVSDLDGVDYPKPYRGKHKILVIAADERYLPTDNGKLFSTGNHPIETLLPLGNDSNLLIVFYVQIMPDDFVMQLHR